MGSKVCGFGTMVTAFGMLGLGFGLLGLNVWDMVSGPHLWDSSRAAFREACILGHLLWDSVPRTPQMNLAKFMGSLEKPIELPN